MSASAPQLPDPSSDITYISSEPFEPRPLIADILRTRFCVPDSIFLVEGVDIAHTSKSRRWRAIRLLLGDGELCIQALLSTEMHRFVDRGDICFGSYVKLQQFRVEMRAGEEKAEMVYLIVESLVLVGWNNTLTDPSIAGQEELDPDTVLVEHGEHEARHDSGEPSQPPKPEERRNSSQTSGEQPEEVKERVVESFDADDDFEIMAVSEGQTAHNRQEIATVIVTQKRDITSSDADATPRPIANLSRPPKLTNLRAIPNLPYKQNWSVNVLCVVSAISDIEPAGIPPYTQRQARLTDPSTEKHVLLTVFLDPEQFNPGIGSVVLLFGVKNHRFDGGSLKKYASDKPKVGESWWYENPTHFSWCDVDGLRRWWADAGMQA
ncbi:hypothetical protein F5Y14DRAFT_428261 [Nemania sp. NC0429]|nr:hypothetical protein F5Y14DRAFT_428261 [Nemania sp. NC0429]